MSGGRARPSPEVRIARDEHERAGHHLVRHRVFVEEQGIFPRSDRDIWDESAVKLVASLGPLIIGAVRIYPLDEAGLWKGDRLAVLPEARRLRAGGPLVRHAVETAGRHGGHRMIAQVQLPNVAFFQHLGWARAGEPGDYHGVPHQLMVIPLAGARDVPDRDFYGWALGAT